jgi:hypothetical protein
MFNYDTNEIDTNTEIKGEFPAVINTAKHITTKTNKPAIVLSYKITGDKFKGMTFDHNYFVIDSPIAMGTKKFFQIVDDLDIPRNTFNSIEGLTSLIGKQVTVIVGKEKEADTFSKVRQVKKFVVPVQTGPGY